MIVTFKMGLKAFINGHGRTTMAQNGGGKGWQWDEETGEKTMPKKWQNLLDWLLQGPDRVPKHQKDWARKMVYTRILFVVSSVILVLLKNGIVELLN